ncbi:hypothetical protein TPY_1619 [Sulfobacillus acidophilus TPY]|uniref:Uncharacterized protein n=1 Tax=Sulfobacillus acidophilus (strain ATCC 700253 / DSM 10332 / NAL) TaxID=679936 RepID=G8U064_SULAD|nr:hypothetical protein TPY_1619 [Sulfobacillus acidophilus TPY]AEW05313.1 hypothetical protein Sulac_1820 [Sulfobacillus acidophilus DSM 10332]
MHWVLYFTYGFYVFTYLTGLTFFIRFDARRRPLRRRLIGMHLILAVTTFIMVTSIMAIGALPKPLPPPRTTAQQSFMWHIRQSHSAELERYLKSTNTLYPSVKSLP